MVVRVCFCVPDTDFIFCSGIQICTETPYQFEINQKIYFTCFTLLLEIRYAMKVHFKRESCTVRCIS